jgi:alpha-beta hydrolase superfamily lysophospholipase
MSGSKATFAVIHGHGEHSGRYQRFAEGMAVHGFSTYALDWRGHGYSQGARGHALSWDELVADAASFTDMVTGVAEGEVVPLGHSFGGSILLSGLIRRRLHPDRFVISSAALRVRQRVPAWKTTSANLLSKYVPGLALTTGLSAEAISREPEVVKAYEQDPLVHSKMSSRLYTEWQAANAEIFNRAAEVTVPYFASHGTDDRIIDAEGTVEFHRRAGVPGSVLKLYDGSFHEPFNDLDSARVFHDLAAWIG